MQEHGYVKLGRQREQPGDHRLVPLRDKAADHVDLADAAITPGRQCATDSLDEAFVGRPARPLPARTVNAVDRDHDAGGGLGQLERQLGRCSRNDGQTDVLLTQTLYGVVHRRDLDLVPLVVLVDVG